MLDALRRFFQPPRTSLEDAQWQAVLQTVALADGLDPERQARLRALVERFLGEKTVTPVAGLILQPPMVHALAALCCLPMLELGPRAMAGWSQVIVYPGHFRAQRSHLDEDTGVMIEGHEDLAGEAWEAGPIVLSWEDVRADLEQPQPGFNVAIHEIAHKLDQLDGSMDGTPPIDDRRRSDWARDFQAAFDALVAAVEAGREPAIDEYAASAPEEFFAVASEYHFTANAYLQRVMPAVAGHLHALYGPPPVLRAPVENAP